MDKSRCESHPRDSRARHHQQWAAVGDAQRLQHVDAEHQKRENGGSGPVHVSSEHRSDEDANGLPRGRHTARYHLRGDIWRHDGAGGRIS